MVRRHLVMLPALCWSLRRRDFYAVTADVSPEGIRFRSASLPSAGEDLTCSIRHIGTLEARIAHVAGQEFVACVRGGRATLADLARQFVSLARAQDLHAEPIRVHRRIVPKQKIVEVTTDSGQAILGHVLNVSASGIALLVDQELEIGATIQVGRKSATVVRRFTHGVGAAFAEPFAPAAVHEAMAL
jgi:hypothetical protein